MIFWCHISVTWHYMYVHIKVRETSKCFLYWDQISLGSYLATGETSFPATWPWEVAFWYVLRRWALGMVHRVHQKEHFAFCIFLRHQVLCDLNLVQWKLSRNFTPFSHSNRHNSCPCIARTCQRPSCPPRPASLLFVKVETVAWMLPLFTSTTSLVLDATRYGSK